MKFFGKFRIRMVLFICVALVTLSGIYAAGALYLDSNTGNFYNRIGLAGHDTQKSQRPNCANDLQVKGVLNRFLPDGWRANWCGGKLWIKHYNSNGTVADALPFDSVKDLSYWLDTHPDCCDVDVDKIVRDKTKVEVCTVVNNACDTTTSTLVNSDKSSASVIVSE